MKRLLALALAGALLAAAAADAKTLRWASQGDPQTADPHSQNEGLTNAANGQVYETLVLRDFHVDNLMLLEGRSGVAACGLLDFQDALVGACAYDLMSLLEDARRDVPESLRVALIGQYLLQRTDIDALQFLGDYRLLAAQRHAKVLGIFVRLAGRDGKHGYLAHLPRTLGLFVRALDADELITPAFQQELQAIGCAQPRGLGLRASD